MALVTVGEGFLLMLEEPCRWEAGMIANFCNKGSYSDLCFLPDQSMLQSHFLSLFYFKTTIGDTAAGELIAIEVYKYNAFRSPSTVM